MFELLGLEVINTGSPEPLPHISRFLPSVRSVTEQRMGGQGCLFLASKGACRLCCSMHQRTLVSALSSCRTLPACLV